MQQQPTRAWIRKLREDPLPYACLGMVGVSLLLVTLTLAAQLRA